MPHMSFMLIINLHCVAAEAQITLNLCVIKGNILLCINLVYLIRQHGTLPESSFSFYNHARIELFPLVVVSTINGTK